MSLLPFFSYYGGKFRAAPRYDAPIWDRIVEPFAGSAGYALRYPDRQVALYDLDENVARTWDYLIHATELEISKPPDIGRSESVDDLNVCDEARLLIGWWLNKGSAQPKRRPSTFMLRYPEGGPYWGPRVRSRIVAQLEAIRHWTIRQAYYTDVDTRATATWFVDPPYAEAGTYYRYGADNIDFAHLASWCHSLPGQVIVCEADDADWLPFRPLTAIDGTEGRQKKSRARIEVVWTSDDVTNTRLPFSA